ncbi:GNAT family N-acetyltransferase [Actibacterium pelagium]|uniref:N-acetyltransferase n=1 Tax=Actibacterium pelagium TaxID=2029103 RepID=A0A917AD27_9RHOB|nr:GNAT family N-acetyltransferase [Actibacterium pelagium]GGE43933.1 N-acetyltransferase [Actibacterium pelagium]
MDGFEIRVATQRDIAPIDVLLSRSYPILLKPDYPPSVLVTALPLISKANPNLITCGTYYVVEDADGVVGAGGWTFAAPTGHQPRRGRGNIRHVVTDHLKLRQGVGRALMQRIFEEAASAGAEWLDCLSTRTAVPFYQSLGFRPMGEVSIDLRPGITFPSVLMERAL